MKFENVLSENKNSLNEENLETIIHRIEQGFDILDQVRGKITIENGKRLATVKDVETQMNIVRRRGLMADKTISVADFKKRLIDLVKSRNGEVANTALDSATKNFRTALKRKKFI